MRWTRYFIPTLKEIPSEAESVSHQLMIRAGLIRKLTSGVYTYLPLGLKVLQKVENIIREEMNKKGGVELFLPSLQPAELWYESGRFKDLGEDLIKFKDRHNRIMVFGPTHEEVITDLVRNHICSYRQLPIIFYQIQTKFRDEIRPRFGAIRSREFIMKDAYSFDKNESGLDESYNKMYEAYKAIFIRCGLDTVAVKADSGIMGGEFSHEFMVISESGEDLLVHCDYCGYAASLLIAECLDKKIDETKDRTDKKEIQEVYTPDVTTIEKVGRLLNKRPEEMVKTLIYVADETPVAVLIRGDYEANETKIKKYLRCDNLEMATPEIIKKVTNGPMGFSGPVGLKEIRLIADYSIRGMENFVTGANKRDTHLINVNLDRDFMVHEWADLRIITERDPCPNCYRDIKIEHAIELGHVFKLGVKYSKAMKAEFLDEDGRLRPIIMGCYGIGVNRIIAASIELHNDRKGIVWPLSIAPFEAIIIPLNFKDDVISDTAEEIYVALGDAGIDVLLDDRDESAGVKFNDADLIGIPLQIVIGEKGLRRGIVEIKIRRTGEIIELKKEELISKITAILKTRS